MGKHAPVIYEIAVGMQQLTRPTRATLQELVEAKPFQTPTRRWAGTGPWGTLAAPVLNSTYEHRSAAMCHVPPSQWEQEKYFCLQLNYIL